MGRSIPLRCGIINLAYDIKTAKENPSPNTISDVIIDVVDFIPNGGAIASYGLSETKEAVEMSIEIEKEYQKKEIIEKFTPLGKQNSDIGHMMEKVVRQKIKQIIRGQ